MFLSPNLDHMLLENIEGGKLHHFKAELDGRCPGVPTEGPVRVWHLCWSYLGFCILHVVTEVCHQLDIRQWLAQGVGNSLISAA